MRLRLAEFLDNWHMKVVSLSDVPATLTPKRYSWYRFLLEAILWSQGLKQWKIPLISLGIEPATFQLVVQCKMYKLIICLAQVTFVTSFSDP